MIFRCQSGYEPHLAREIRPLGLVARNQGGGWLETNTPPDLATISDLCFAHAILPGTEIVAGESVNSLAADIAEFFFSTTHNERFKGRWPLIFDYDTGVDGLSRRVGSVEKFFAELLRKRMSRVAKLGTPALPAHAPGLLRGLFLFFPNFHSAFISREIISGGQRRMADDLLAPSRSYLKIEEAYGILGREPAPRETVVDLGAAPGGWSYSAAKRGARVVAVDNGPLKAGALDNPLITHIEQDAFRFDPTASAATGNAPVNWLFCDLVENPRRVLDAIVVPWLERRWCRRFIVNLKFGRVADLMDLLRDVRARVPAVRVRHLYHDREEITLMGEIPNPKIPNPK